MCRAVIRLIVTVFFILTAVGCKENAISPVETGSIRGRVLREDDRLPLKGAIISTNPATESLLSADDGTFVIDDAPAGTYVVSATFEGYEKETVTISVRGGRETHAILVMSYDNRSSTVPPPALVFPPDEYTNAEVSVQLIWSRRPVRGGDSLYFTVHLYEGGSPDPFRVMSNIRDTSLLVENLRYGQTYFWQVTAVNATGESSHGEIWRFQTEKLPDNRFLFTGVDGIDTEIFSSDSAGLTMLQLTSLPSRDLWPRYNRWRNKIAFISDREGEYHIHTMNPDGSAQQRVTTLPVSGYHNNGIGFCWSPDGVWLFYAHYDKLYRIDQFGGNRAIIATAPNGRHFREVEWSLQYDRLVVHAVGSNPYDSELLLLKSNGTLEKELMGNVPGTLGAPSFSVDGRSVLFTRDLSGYESSDGRRLNTHIMSVTVDQQDTVDLSYAKVDGTNDLFPRYSPDGAWIIFVNQPNDNSLPGDVWIMRHDGTARRRLFQAATHPDWK